MSIFCPGINQPLVFWGYFVGVRKVWNQDSLIAGQEMENLTQKDGQVRGKMVFFCTWKSHIQKCHEFSDEKLEAQMFNGIITSKSVFLLVLLT